MDSFVLAETFKYLYLLFSEKSELVLDVEDFVFTTEAHLLPLTLSVGNYSWSTPISPAKRAVRPDIYRYTFKALLYAAVNGPFCFVFVCFFFFNLSFSTFDFCMI